MPPAEAANVEKGKKDYKQLYEELTIQYNDLYEDVGRRDNTITELQQELKTERVTAHKHQQENFNLKLSLDNYSKYDRTEQDAEDAGRERVAGRLAQLQKRGDDFQAFYNAAQTENEEHKKAIKNIRDDRDRVKIDLTTAHTRIDELENEIQRLATEAPQNVEALRYLEAINENLDGVFAEKGQTLTPDAFAEHLQTIQRQAELNRHASGASLNSHFESANNDNQTVRKSSMAHELAVAEALEKDDESQHEDSAETDPGLSIPKTRRMSGEKVRIAQKQAFIEDLTEKVNNLEDQKLHDQTKIRELEKQIADQQKTINENNASIEKAAVENKKVDDEKAAIEKQRADDEKTTAQQTAPIANGKPKSSSTDVTRTHTKYVEVTRDASVWQAFIKAPWWHKLLMTLFILICICFAVAGWSERQMWLSANENARQEIRFLNAIPVEWDWQHKFEQWLGLDTTMLG